MASLTEILILQESLPIDVLDLDGAGAVEEESRIRGFIEQGRLSEVDLAKARATYGGLPFFELADYPVDPKAVSLIAPAICRRHNMLPVEVRDDGVLLVATSDPENIFALDDARAASHMRVLPVVAEPSDLSQAINRYIRADDELSDLSSSMEDEQVAVDAEVPVVEDSSDDAPIVRFVNLIIAQAIQDRASDIHIEPAENSVRVRYRIDGVLHEMPSAPKSIQGGVTSRLKIMSDIDIAERRKPQDGRMSVTNGGKQVDLRVATLPTVWGEKIVLRILDTSGSTRGLSDLHMLDHNFQRYQAAFSQPYGMILVTGPTGSGKSTCLYTTLGAVARPEVNVVTVEDPVEYRMPGINQVQVNPKAGLTFASALRSILRADPDVVLIGEIRDHETAQIAIESSLTGHLVLSTLHTNDAPSAVTRLIEMEIEPFLVGSALDCVVAQRLARRLCERCKQPVEYPLEQLRGLGFLARQEEEEPPQLFQPVGCPSCSKTGYRSRIAVHEVMPVSEEIERLAVRRASSTEIGNVAREQGMLSLREDGFAKVRLGLTSIEEVLRVVAD